MFRWLFRRSPNQDEAVAAATRSPNQDEAVAAATRFLHTNNCRVVANEWEDTGDDITLRFKGAELHGNQWSVLFDRLLPPAVLVSHPEIEVRVHSETGVAKFHQQTFYSSGPVNLPKTEEDWLTNTDPTPMLEFMTGKVSDRKFRLFGCACLRTVWHLVATEDCRIAAERYKLDPSAPEVYEYDRIAVETTERYVDGRATEGDWGNAIGESSWGFWNLAAEQLGVAAGVVFAVRRVVREAVKDGAVEAEIRARLADLLRDIVGNPFRPVSVDDSWLTSTVVAIAKQMYESRDFSAMPILADALQDAGCDQEDVLAHCRGEGTHVRGCWVVDHMLGKQ